MRIVIQRVSRASVSIDGQVKSFIGKCLLVLLGIGANDGEEDVQWLVKKLIGLRIFDDETGTMNLSVTDVQGEILVVSQFTLMASCKKGNRPSWIHAAPHEISIPLYHRFCDVLTSALGKKIGTGEFGAYMKVDLLNDGPVTICMDSHNKE